MRPRTQIKLSFPDEYLTAVSGHYSPVAHGGSPVIRSLAFRSSQRAYGPFGAAEGTPFTFPVDGGVIVGFCGRSGWQLDAVGLYVAALRPERMYDRVHKIGLSAYRAVMHRIGPQQQQQERAGETAERQRYDNSQDVAFAVTCQHSAAGEPGLFSVCIQRYSKCTNPCLMCFYSFYAEILLECNVTRLASSVQTPDYRYSRSSKAT